VSQIRKGAVFETLLATEHYLGYRSPLRELSHLPHQDRPAAACWGGRLGVEARDRD
jgi:hypothetical protein